MHEPVDLVHLLVQQLQVVQLGKGWVSECSENVNEHKLKAVWNYKLSWSTVGAAGFAVLAQQVSQVIDYALPDSFCSSFLELQEMLPQNERGEGFAVGCLVVVVEVVSDRLSNIENTDTPLTVDVGE